jgi:hypothetical protein
LIPVGVFGALAKETFVPFSVAFALGWGGASWLEDRGALVSVGTRPQGSWPVAVWLSGAAVLGVAGIATLTVVFSIANGHPVWPWQLVWSGLNYDVGFWQRAVAMLKDVTLLYVFGWLVPLGIPGLTRCPRRWIAGALLSAAAAVVLGALNAEPGLARSLFNILGPILSFGSALTISRALSATQ